MGIIDNYRFFLLKNYFYIINKIGTKRKINNRLKKVNINRRILINLAFCRAKGIEKKGERNK